MTKRLVVGLTSLLALAIWGQQVKEEATVVNVEVPVRVFRGSAFVDNLTTLDFEVLEAGVPQKVEAVYLVKKRSIARREEEREFKPETARNFYLFFEISDYLPQLDGALRYFIDEVLVPGDTIVLVTPLKTYRLLREALAARPKSEILKQFRGILRRDVLAGASAYRSTVNDLEVLARALAEQVSRVNPPGALNPESLTRTDSYSSPETEARTVDDLLTQYANILGQLDDLRMVDERAILEFTKYLKAAGGQRYVYIFYQREFVPKIDPRILIQYQERYQDRPDIQQTISGLFDFYRRELTFDPETVKRAFADSSVSCHFLYLAPPPELISGIRLQEQSEDIYAAFKEIARASGGFTASSANPTYLLKSAVEASENYYLLYYSPRNYARDGEFREIKVRVREAGCRVIHRLGYFAR